MSCTCSRLVRSSLFFFVRGALAYVRSPGLSVAESQEVRYGSSSYHVIITTVANICYRGQRHPVIVTCALPLQYERLVSLFLRLLSTAHCNAFRQRPSLLYFTPCSIQSTTNIPVGAPIFVCQYRLALPVTIPVGALTFSLRIIPVPARR